MNPKIMRLMFEAFRRNDIADDVERSKPLGRRWLGLGTEAAYRPAIEAGLMVFHDGQLPPVRCMGWLVLTPAGERFLREHAGMFSTMLKRIKEKTDYLQTYEAHYQLIGGITR